MIRFHKKNIAMVYQESSETCSLVAVTVGVRDLFVLTKLSQLISLTWPIFDCHAAKHSASSRRKAKIYSTEALQLDQQIDQILHRWSTCLAKVGSYLEAKHKCWLSVRCFFFL